VVRREFCGGVEDLQMAVSKFDRSRLSASPWPICLKEKTQEPPTQILHACAFSAGILCNRRHQIVVNDASGEVNVFVCASTGIDVSGLSQGQTIEVTGFSGQFADHFEVDPRSQSDIRILD
jgi:hypothetical protein